MKLSIIVPVYNVENYLRECIDSILEQDFTNYELILVDDGSPDECGKICDEYAAQDRRIWVVHKPNGGLSSARNTGLDMATGDYVTFVDADDYIASNYYSKAIRAILKEPDIDLIEMPVVVYFNQPNRKIYSPNIPNTVRGKEEIFATWIRNKGYLHAYAWNKIYRKSLFDKIRFPEGMLFEDTYTTPRLIEQCEVLHYIPYEEQEVALKQTQYPHTGAYYYRLRGKSITTATTYKGFRDALTNHLDLFEQTKMPLLKKRTRNIYYLHLTNFFIDLLRCKEACVPSNIDFARECMTRLKNFRFTIISLWKARLSPRTKLKNLPLALFGPEFHCFLYTGRWIKSYPVPTNNKQTT